MNEFQEKVEAIKQTFREPGFTADDGFTKNEEPASEPETQEQEQEVEQVAKPETQEATTRKKHESLKRRVQDLAYENKIKEAQNRELLARLEYQEQMLAKQQERVQAKEQEANSYYENTLATQENAVIHALRKAREDDDIDAEIALQKQLAEIAAQKSTYSLYQNQIKPIQSAYETPYESPAPQPYYQQPPYQQPNYEEPAPEHEHLQNWLENNPWADPNSRHFSQKLRNEIDEVASELNERLKYNGVAHMIGQPEYFSTLDSIMSDRYGLQKAEPAEPRTEPRNNQSLVAPVSRSGSNMADQYISNNPNSNRGSTPLTDVEYRIARNLQVKMSDGSGRWTSGDEAIKRWAKEKQRYAGNTSTKLIID